jgi:hypothetical protein
MRAFVATLMLLAVPVIAGAQTPEHPLTVACAAGVSPEVTTTRLQLAIEPRGRDTAASRAWALALFAGWTPPADLAVPSLSVREPTVAGGCAVSWVARQRFVFRLGD